MADKEDKVEENVEGRYYVDVQCMDCDMCRELAPDIFARDDENCCSYVKAQPINEEQEALCREAMEGCCVEAIGDDG